MVRFCSESLLVVPVFFSVVHFNLFLWKNLLQRPLDVAGLSSLMSVVFGSDSTVLFIFRIHISVMTFYLWHLVRDFILPIIRSSLVLQVSWSRPWVGFCCSGLDMNFSTIFCSIFIPICLPKSLSLQLLQHLPWQCPFSCKVHVCDAPHCKAGSNPYTGTVPGDREILEIRKTEEAHWIH